MTPIITARLTLRPLENRDADFIQQLLNDSDWIRFIGDKNVHSHEDALRYMRDGPQAMYAKHGLGLLLTEITATGEAIGLTGLIKRDGLDDVDLGFAFLPSFRSQGYAREAAQAMLDWGRLKLGLRAVVAITTFDNAPSASLLQRLGFARDGEVMLPKSEEALHKYRLTWATTDSDLPAAAEQALRARGDVVAAIDLVHASQGGSLAKAKERVHAWLATQPELQAQIQARGKEARVGFYVLGMVFVAGCAAAVWFFTR